MSDRLPERFEDLGVAELRRSAIEDFAVPVDPADNKKIVLAALMEAGVTWDDYAGQHPEVLPEPVVVADAAVITNPAAPVSNEALSVDSMQSLDPAEKFDPSPEQPAAVQGQVRTYERPKFNPNDKLLIKMERKNPLYEVRGYKFTQGNPYALVSPQDADFILRNEDGFRQALPSELQEFYG